MEAGDGVYTVGQNCHFLGIRVIYLVKYIMFVIFFVYLRVIFLLNNDLLLAEVYKLCFM